MFAVWAWQRQIREKPEETQAVKSKRLVYGVPNQKGIGGGSEPLVPSCAAHVTDMQLVAYASLTAFGDDHPTLRGDESEAPWRVAGATANTTHATSVG